MQVSELIAVFIAWNRVHRRPRTADYYAGQLRGWERVAGGLAVEDVRPLDCLAWASSRARVVALQRLYSWAIMTAGIVTTSPAASIERPRIGSRKRTFTAREQARLMRGAAADFRRVLIGARETAARPQEIRGLDWEELHVADPKAAFWAQVLAGRSYFVLGEYKGMDRRGDGGPSRILPVSPRFGRLLFRTAIVYEIIGPVFRNCRGNGWTANAVRLRMSRLRRRVGLGLGPTGEAAVMYHWRHTTATRWAAAGVAPKALAEALGHSSITTTDRYLHLSRWQALQAIRKTWEKRPPAGRDGPAGAGGRDNLERCR